MNLLLRPHENYNDPTWSVIISIIILLIGVLYIIIYILGIDESESHGNMTPPSRKSCYNFRVIEINRVVDGDTIDVTIDLGFDLYKKERVRIAGVDTPEKRTRDLDEKELGIDATNWMKEKLDGAISGDDDLIIRTELVGGMGKYGSAFLVGYILEMERHR